MDERLLRQLLWLNHGCGFDGIYGDDGEMQCNNIPVHYPIDFKRDNPKLIERKLMERHGKFVQTEHGEVFVPNETLMKALKEKQNKSFDFLDDEKEDIYTESDGTKLEEKEGK
jgi:hypothetical protein